MDADKTSRRASWTPEGTVLFLCTGNYYRSRTAEALWNHYAAQQSSGWTARSRGLRLNAGNKGPISKYAKTWLDERGISYDHVQWPVDVSEADLQVADIVVAVDVSEHRPMMAQRFPAWVDRIDYWHVHDIDKTAPDAALASIDGQVQALLDKLHGRSVDRGTPKAEDP